MGCNMEETTSPSRNCNGTRFNRRFDVNIFLMGNLEKDFQYLNVELLNQCQPNINPHLVTNLKQIDSKKGLLTWE